MQTLIKSVLAVLFLGCLFDLDYGYFQLIRFLGMVGFAILAYKQYQLKNRAYTVLWVASSILINPIFKIHLGRDLWYVVDIVWAILLVYSIYLQNRKRHEGA
jgi:hypothetical protein